MSIQNTPQDEFDPEAKALRDIERAIRVGAVRALRTRADKQRQRAADGIASAGERFSNIVVRSPEAAMAEKLANTFERIAADIEAGAPL